MNDVQYYLVSGLLATSQQRQGITTLEGIVTKKLNIFRDKPKK